MKTYKEYISLIKGEDNLIYKLQIADMLERCVVESNYSDYDDKDLELLFKKCCKIFFVTYPYDIHKLDIFIKDRLELMKY